MGIIGMLIFIPIASVSYALFREVIYLLLKRERCRYRKNIKVLKLREILLLYNVG